MERTRVNSTEIDSTILWLVFLISLVYTLFAYETRVWKFLKKFPGPPVLPVFGNALQLSNPDEFLNTIIRWAKMYGDRVRIKLGYLNLLVVLHPDDIEKLLSSNTVTTKSMAYTFFSSTLGDGLLTSSGSKWHTRRKLVNPAFHVKILEGFQGVFNEQSEVLVDLLQGMVARGEAVEMFSMFARCSLDILCETAMGKKLNCQKELANSFAVVVVKHNRILYNRLKSPWLHPNFLFQLTKFGRMEKAHTLIIRDFVGEVIRDRKAQMRADNSKNTQKDTSNELDDVFFSSKKRSAFLDLLLQLQEQGAPGLDDEGILNETSTFMIAGYDTTAASLTFTLYCLGCNPEAQARVHEELDAVFEDDRSRSVTTRDLVRLKYLECCVKEALRLYPSAPYFGRKVVEDFKLDDDTVVPAGVELLVMAWLVHRHPKFYDDPEEFRPSRHFPENARARHPYAYIPFSAGPRSCIGQRYAVAEEKVILAHVLRNFRVRAVEAEKVVFLPEIVLTPKNGVHFQLAPR